MDLISYGQTGSSKTFTMFGPPHSMAEAAAVQKSSGSGSGISDEGILLPEHGLFLCSDLDSLARMQELEARGCTVALHGSMIATSILSFQDQNCTDLLIDMAVCFVDDDHHLQGATQKELRSAAERGKVRESRMQFFDTRRVWQGARKPNAILRFDGQRAFCGPEFRSRPEPEQ